METVVNDIAVIKLCSGEKWTGETVSLPSYQENNDFDHYWAFGWGNMDSDGGWDFPEILQWVQTPTIDWDTCKSDYSGLDSYYTEDMIICAGEEGKDSCQGDSGGPLVQYGSDCEAVVWGIAQ